MELWIRSQKGLYLAKATKVTIDYKSSENVYFIKVNNDKFVAGEYYSMERALEVLDEIQELLKPNYIRTYEYKGYDEQPNTIVYEMPEE